MHSKMKLTPEEKKILFALRDPDKREKLLNVMSRKENEKEGEKTYLSPSTIMRTKAFSLSEA